MNRSVYDRTQLESSSASTPAEPRRLPSASSPAAPEHHTEVSPSPAARIPLARALRHAAPSRQCAEPSAGSRFSTHRASHGNALGGHGKTRRHAGSDSGFFPCADQQRRRAHAAAPSVHSATGREPALQLNNTAPGEHPLAPAVRWAKLCMQKMDGIKDYSAKMAKRERIDGALTEYEYLYVKVRHEPFSVYLSFIGPARVKGQEAIFVKGRNNGNLMAHATGVRKIFGTVSLKPDSMLAMTGNRYPITELGIKRLTERLIEVGDHDAKFDECTVKATANVKINGRECVCLQVNHPTPRAEFLFSKAKIYVDSQYNVPVRYEAYDWPRSPGASRCWSRNTLTST